MVGTAHLAGLGLTTGEALALVAAVFDSDTSGDDERPESREPGLGEPEKPLLRSLSTAYLSFFGRRCPFRASSMMALSRAAPTRRSMRIRKLQRQYLRPTGQLTGQLAILENGNRAGRACGVGGVWERGAHSMIA